MQRIKCYIYIHITNRLVCTSNRPIPISPLGHGADFMEVVKSRSEVKSCHSLSLVLHMSLLITSNYLLINR